MTLTPVKTENIFLQGLNPQQKEAAEIIEGPVCLVAIPGSGKSTCLTRRLGSILVHHGVEPQETLTMTFTRKAAEEMKAKLRTNIHNHYAIHDTGLPFDQLDSDRQYSIGTMVHHDYIKHLNIGTFHSVCSRILRKNIGLYEEQAGKWTSGFSFMERLVVNKQVKEIAYKQMNLDMERYPVGNILDSISKFKRQSLAPEDVGPVNRYQELMQEIYTALRKFQVQENVLDFDDMIMMTARLLAQDSDVRRRYHNTFRHVSVDEFQDTDTAQYDIVKSICCNGLTGQQFTNWENRSLFVVGDIDQCIYTWRGAEMQIMLDFEQDFTNESEFHNVKILKIEHNYRSTSTITGAANQLIKNNSVRIDKDIIPSRDSGSKIQVVQKKDNHEEAKFIAQEIKKLKEGDFGYSYRDFAVLVRQNAFTLAIEKAMTAQGIPYMIGGGHRFNERREIKILLGYLQLLANPDDNTAFNYIVNVPKRGIGATTLNKVYEVCREQEISAWNLITTTEDLKGLVGRGHKAMTTFIEFMNELMEETKEMDVVDTLKVVMDKIKIYQYLASEAENSEMLEEKQENVDALINVAHEFLQRQPDGGLQEFIDQMVLDGIESEQKEQADAVRIMTVHASKGLEFPVVFIAGMEAGGFPAKPDVMSPENLEESRRLFYVAVTRAKDHLYLTWAKNRWVMKTSVNSRGQRSRYEELEIRQPSPFIAEIPKEYRYSAMEAV